MKIILVDIIKKNNSNRQIQDEDYIFKNYKYEQIKNQDKVQKALSTIVKNAKISNQNINPLDLRYNFGRLLLINGADIKIVSKFLGHKNLMTTINLYSDIINEKESKTILMLFYGCIYNIIVV